MDTLDITTPPWDVFALDNIWSPAIKPPCPGLVDIVTVWLLSLLVITPIPVFVLFVITELLAMPKNEFAFSPTVVNTIVALTIFPWLSS